MAAEVPSPSNAPAPGERRLARTLAAPGGLLAILALLLIFLTVNQLVMVRDARDWVRHTHAVIETTQSLFSHVQDVESGQRGYMLSGDPTILNGYAVGLAQAPAEMRRLAFLVRDNPAQVERVRRIVALANERIEVSTTRVELERRGRTAEARAWRPHTGRNSMNELRRLITDVIDDEQNLLAQRTARSDAAVATGFILSLVVGALALGGLGWLIVAMARNNRQLAHEIRERRTAELARQEGEALYRAIFTNAADYLYVLKVSPDETFSVEELSPSFERATGITTRATRGRDLSQLAAGPWGQGLIDQLRAVVREGKAAFLSSPSPPRAPGRTWESILSPVRGPGGRIDRIVGSTRDVTERREAEAQLRRAQRMEAVGHLTGGVAHDFNNLLQVIRGNLELLTRTVAGDEAASQRLRNAIHGADRAAQLTRQLLAFARRQPLEPRVVNLGRLVNDMADMLRSSVGERVQVETIVAGGLWNTLADPAQVENAILNLAINARDAMDGVGKLTIEITNAAVDAAYGRAAEIEPGQYVLLGISDTGCGMDEATRARVFEPFFTTKGADKGTGLGLSMVYGFVKQSNGHVQVYSEVGHGTTIKIYLPRSHQTETVAAAPRDMSLRGQSEVILVVEDDELVRASAVGMLRDLGYICIHAHDGAAALKVLEDGVKIDLLFTDVIMPGPVKSRDVVAAVHRLRPGVPVLYTSGYTENAIVHHGRLDEGVQLLSKPYTRDDLARKVRAMLSDARRTVLVVEDDALVRMAAEDMIESLGFGVLQAGDAAQALNILESSATVDVLFTDIGLPDVRGPALAEQALKARPGLKVVFASGYGETAETAGVEGALHLDKPYNRDQLAAVLGSAVGD
jgi:PAS domain S-box-containing protein